MDETRCWAFNDKGQRCEGSAGHAGHHLLTVTWDDSAVWVPVIAAGHVAAAALRNLAPVPTVDGVSTTISDPAALLSVVPGMDEPTPEPGKCVVCDHPQKRHDATGCQAKHPEMGNCPCLNYVGA